MILSPYFWVAVLVAALALTGTGYHYGHKHATDRAAAQQLVAVAKARFEAIAQAKQDQQTARNYETTRETVRTVYVKIKEKAHENIAKNRNYADCSLDADGLRLYNSHPGRAENPAAIADSPVPGFAERTGWQTVDHPGKQSGTIADVLRLPGASQSPVGMGVGGTGSAEKIANIAP